MINGGRLSVPSVYDTPLSTPDSERWRGGPCPGASMRDAPLSGADGKSRFLTDAFLGAGRKFALLEFANGAAAGVPSEIATIRTGDSGFGDPSGLLGERYDAAPGTAYLLRPDGYVAARFRHPTRAAIDSALARATATDGGL
jgi:3-(3-hydroxy-phenyl)propionate hydroxylase